MSERLLLLTSYSEDVHDCGWSSSIQAEEIVLMPELNNDNKDFIEILNCALRYVGDMPPFKSGKIVEKDTTLKARTLENCIRVSFVFNGSRRVENRAYPMIRIQLI